MPLIRYLFIDGGCLRAATETMLAKLPGQSPAARLNLNQLAAGFDRAFYYDVVSARAHGETVSDYNDRVELEHVSFDEIRALDGFHVSLGEIKGQGNKRRQKRVDVHLAVDMLTHSFRKNMQSATLLAGDDDFIPLVEALVREGMKIELWHPPQATRELRAAADRCRLFDLQTCYDLLSMDGAQPLFRFTSSGGGEPPRDVDSWSWTIEGRPSYAVFQDESLTVWKWERDSFHFNRLACGQASLQQAAAIFSMITKWPVLSRDGEDLSWQS